MSNTRTARHVATYTSEPGESMDAFALRITPAAVRLGFKGTEVCGEFEREGDGWRIALWTVDRRAECYYPAPSDARWTGQTYHTHPESMSPAFSEHDYAYPGYMARGRVLLHQSGSRESVRRVR